MNENEVKKEAVRKQVIATAHYEVEKFLLEQYYEQKENYCKKAVIQVAKDLGYKNLVLNLLGK